MNGLHHAYITRSGDVVRGPQNHAANVTQISGNVATGFEPVHDAFERNFTDNGDVGAAVAVYLHGELVVDLVGGVADPESGRAYDQDSLQLVFSATKGAAAICAHLLAQRGLLDFDARVADVWPEFGEGGKQDVPIRMLLNHQVGLPYVEAPLTLDEILAVQPVVDALAAQKPLWEPGSAHGYHAITYGWLVGELVRRIDGRDIGAFFADEVATPLGLDFWIGLPAQQDGRVAPLIARDRNQPSNFDPSMLTPEVIAILPELLATLSDPNSTGMRALTMSGVLGLSPEDFSFNDPQLWRSQMPGANGITNARSLARMYAACVGDVDGVRLLEPETVAIAAAEESSGRDEALILPTRFGLGFFLPSAFSPLMSPASFGHSGAGGSLGFADPELEVGFGYVMNQMGAGLSNDPRAGALVDAVKSCLA